MKTANKAMSNGIGTVRVSRSAVALGAGMAVAAAVAATLPSLGLHAPDWSLMAAQSPVVKAHVAAAVGALGIGAGLMLGVKGRRLHRVFGWACALLIFATAFSSVFIRESNNGGFSLIHGLSAWVLLVTPVAVIAARRHNVARHRKMMSGLFYGGLIVAGLFTFTPGRVMFEIFFG